MSSVTRLPEPSNSKGRVSAEIRARLGRYQINQGDLAVALGITQSQVSKRLRGAIAFNLDELDTVAGFFGVTTVELLGGSVGRGPDSPGQPVTGGLPSSHDPGQLFHFPLSIAS